MVNVIQEEWLRKNMVESDGLAAVKVAFAALGKGACQQPPIMQLKFPEARGETCIKSAALQGSKTFTIKVASGFYNNSAKGLPSSSGMLTVLDSTTGAPKAVLLDGGYLTDLRTGAAGALAAELLATKGPHTVAVLGSGIQARFQLRAISRVRQCATVACFSPNQERLHRYCDDMKAELCVPVRAASSAEDCVRGASIIVTTTPSQAALVQAEWVAAGCTVIAVGSDTPGKQELAVELLKKADKVVCDSQSQCERLGELQHCKEVQIHAELGQVLLGKVAARESDAEVIVVDLTGCGAQDAAMADHALQAYAAAQ